MTALGAAFVIFSKYSDPKFGKKARSVVMGVYLRKKFATFPLLWRKKRALYLGKFAINLVAVWLDMPLFYWDTAISAEI